MSAIVVTWNRRHFKALAARVPEGYRQRFRNLGLISFRCNETHGRRRIEELIESIEFEYVQAQKRADKRLIIEITESVLRIER